MCFLSVFDAFRLLRKWCFSALFATKGCRHPLERQVWNGGVLCHCRFGNLGHATQEMVQDRSPLGFGKIEAATCLFAELCVSLVMGCLEQVFVPKPNQILLKSFALCTYHPFVLTSFSPLACLHLWHAPTILQYSYVWCRTAVVLDLYTCELNMQCGFVSFFAGFGLPILDHMAM